MPENKVLLKEFRSRMAPRLADKAANRLRGMIVENLFDFGEPLSEQGLAEMLGMSRTPIREAITQLEQEGLLRVIAGRGAFVVELTKRDFEEINDLRLVLEPLAAVSAMHSVPPSMLDEHREVWTGLLKQFESGEEMSPAILSKKDDELHFMIILHCKNLRLRNFLRVLRFQIHRYVFAHWNTRERIGETIRQHLDILSAFSSRDAGALERALVEHIDYNRTYLGHYIS